jgi:hypothetical protein
VIRYCTTLPLNDNLFKAAKTYRVFFKCKRITVHVSLLDFDILLLRPFSEGEKGSVGVLKKIFIMFFVT